jgi:hypothetical protein
MSRCEHLEWLDVLRKQHAQKPGLRLRNKRMIAADEFIQNLHNSIMKTFPGERKDPVLSRFSAKL